LYFVLNAHADKLINRSWQILSAVPGATTQYVTSFTVNTNTMIGSLTIEVCANTPVQDDACTVPTGLDLSNVTLSSQTGITDFSVANTSVNTILLTRTPSVITPPQPVSLTFNNVVNPSSIGSYYPRLTTYASDDGSGSAIDFGGLAFSINNGLTISSKVPPYIVLCSAVSINNYDCSAANGDYLNLGELSATTTKSAESQLVVYTNAPNGFNVQMSGNTLTSGNNVVPAIANPDVSRPGTAQFGINLRANTSPTVGADPVGPGSGTPSTNYDVPNKYLFNNGDIIASGTTSQDYRKYTVSYIANVPKDQATGVYVSTITYTGTGSF